MKYKLLLLFILISVNGFSQEKSSKIRARGHIKNALISENAYLKYIYSFPFSTEKNYDPESGKELEIRKYQNQEIIDPLIQAIFDEGARVFDPNYWGSIEDLIQMEQLTPIDTGLILRYMHAGWDTAYSYDGTRLAAAFPFYTKPVFTEIAGLFFFESWYLDKKTAKLVKDVVAYFPIREYLRAGGSGDEPPEQLRRLIFMVYPDAAGKNAGKSGRNTKGQKDKIIYDGINYEFKLYNRPYHEYLYRLRTPGLISQQDFEEWEYHTFDFYKDFNAEIFLKYYIMAVLNGKLKAYDPEQTARVLDLNEFYNRLIENPSLQQQELPQSILASAVYKNLNSVIFNEAWFFNDKTLQIKKKINSITFIKHKAVYDNYTGDFLRIERIPVFTIKYK